MSSSTINKNSHRCLYMLISMPLFLNFEDITNIKLLFTCPEMLPQGDNSMAFLFDIHGTGLEKSPEAKSNFIELLVAGR
jgi:hypothetical protein